MNHLKASKLNERTRKAAAKLTRDEMDRFRAYLAGPKFSAPGEQYIGTHEVLALLDRLAAIENLADDKRNARRWRS